MSQNLIAECVHSKPKKIPLLTSGKVLPLVMHEWELTCLDFFATNKKLVEADWVEAILPGLRDLHAHDWIVTYCKCLITILFTNVMKEIRKEFLPDSWDDDLHSCLLNSQLWASDNFMTWVNNLHYQNLTLLNTDYHLSDDALCQLLETLLDPDLCTHCKNHKVKETVDAATDSTGNKSAKIGLMTWIAEV